MEVLDRLIGAVRRCCEGFPDPRRGDNGSYAMADFGLAAFSVFFAQSPSFLAHQRQLAAGHGRSNANTLFGMSRIPGDSHIRRMLDPVAPDHLFPVFDEVIGDLERAGGLAAFQRLGSRVLIALDGTEYHRSTKIHCPHCSTRTRAGQPPKPSPPSRPPPSWRPAISTWCRSPRSSSGRRTGTTSRTARAAPCGAGLLGTAPAWPGSILCILATTSMLASRCARRCSRRVGTSCSPASPPRIRPSRSI